MRQLGDKASARQVAIDADVPVIPATDVLGDDLEVIKREAAEIGFRYRDFVFFSYQNEHCALAETL
jgi:biotin carboxylase